MEAAIAGPFPKPEQKPQQHNGFFGVIGDPRAYGALMFMLLALPTGIFYFVWAVVGVSLSVPFLLFIFGIPFALLFLGSVRILSHVEGRIVEGLLGVRMPRRLPASPAADETVWARIRDALTDVRTWSSLLYLVLRLPLGIIYFTLAVVGIVLPVALIGGSFFDLVTDQSHVLHFGDLPWLDHLFHTAPGLILLMVFGAFLIFVVLHMTKGIGWLHGHLAELLLVRL